MHTTTHQTTHQQNKTADTLFNPHQPVEKQSFAHTHEAPQSQAPFNFGSTPLLSSSPMIIQPKLTINAPGDRYEQEADRIAEQVMRMPKVDAPTQVGNEPKVSRKPLVSQISPVIQRMPEPIEDEEELVQTKLMPNIQRMPAEMEDEEGLLQTKPMPGIQRKCSKCGAEEEEHLQRKPIASQITPVIQRMPEEMEEEDELLQTKQMPGIQRKCANCQKEEEEQKQTVQTKSAGTSPRSASSSLTSRIQSSRGHGHTMDAATSSFMSSRFGIDFSGVCIHADSSAAQMSQEINAQAFTVGQDIYFNRGKYSPGTESGKRLLAHELTHVVQQGRGNLSSRQVVQKEEKPKEEYQVKYPRPNISDPKELFELMKSFMEEDKRGVDSGAYWVLKDELYVFKPDGSMKMFLLNERASFPESGYYVNHNKSKSWERLYLSPDGRYRGIPWTGKHGKIDVPNWPQNPKELKKWIDDLSPNFIILAVLPSYGDGGRGGLSADAHATKINKKIQQFLKAKRKGTAETRNTKADQQIPDRVIPWKAKDGQNWVNVWVNKDHRSIKVNPDKTPEELMDEIANTTVALRQKQQQAALNEENKSAIKGWVPLTDSSYTGNANGGLKANRPAYPAKMEGPVKMVLGGTGTYKMQLEWGAFELGHLLSATTAAFSGAEYIWEVIDITSLYQQVLSSKVGDIQRRREVSKRMEQAKHSNTKENQSVGKLAGDGRQFHRTGKYLVEDTLQAVHDLQNPMEASGGSGVNAVSNVLMNTFNLSQTGLHALMSYGAWLVQAFPAVFANKHNYREIPFPETEGYYLVRCIAQPRPKGNDKDIIHAPSLAVKIVEVKNIQARVKEELEDKEANLESRILELLISFRMLEEKQENEALKKQLVDELELRIQEAASSHRGFLKKQLDLREEEYDRKSSDIKPTLDLDGNSEEQVELDKIQEEISLLKQGFKKNAGRISQILFSQINIKRAAIAKLSEKDPKRKRLTNDLDTLWKRYDTAKAREEKFDPIEPVFRPSAVFVNEENGQTYPLLIEIGLKEKHGKELTYFLSDVTSKSTDEYEAKGESKYEAIHNLLILYAGHFPFGRGYMSIRFPKSSGIYTIADKQYRCNPRDIEQASERLDELLQILSVLGLFVPGVGTAVAIASAAVAVARLIKRILNNTFDWDLNAVNDMIAILGAVASGATSWAKGRVIRSGKFFALVEGTAYETQAVAKFHRATTIAKAIDALNEAADFAGHFIGQAELITNFLEIQEQVASGAISPAQARRNRAKIIGEFLVNEGLRHLEPKDESSTKSEHPSPPEKMDGNRSSKPKESASTGHPERQPGASHPHGDTPKHSGDKTTSATDGTGHASPNQPSDNSSKPVAKEKTPDGQHEVKLLDDGRIVRCSDFCGPLQDRYGHFLDAESHNPKAQELKRRMNELDRKAVENRRQHNQTEDVDLHKKLDLEAQKLIEDYAALEQDMRNLGYERGFDPDAQHRFDIAVDFISDPDNLRGLLSGDKDTMKRLLESHGNWQELILKLEAEGGMYDTIASFLQEYRDTIVEDLKKFNLFKDPGASTEPSSDVDLSTTGPKAGENLIEAENYMREKYGENWNDMFHMNFYTEAGRLFAYTRELKSMSSKQLGALMGGLTKFSEALNYAKWLQLTKGDPKQAAGVYKLIADLPPNLRKFSIEMSSWEVTPKTLENIHKQIDALQSSLGLDKLPSDDPRRIHIAARISMLQMIANFYTKEAHLSPGAARHIIHGVAVKGHEGYQSSMYHITAILEQLHKASGNVELAIKKYEYYKYVNRFIEAMITSGIQPNAFMLEYYRIAHDIYRNRRDEVKGVGKHDLGYLKAMHQQFMDEAMGQTLPELKGRALRNPSDWNPSRGSLDRPKKGPLTHIGDNTSRGTKLNPLTLEKPLDISKRLESAGWGGSGLGVRKAEVQIRKGETKTVAIKIYREAQRKKMEKEMEGAIAAERTSLGPIVYGEVKTDMEGLIGFAMDIVPGGFFESAGDKPKDKADALRTAKNINAQTFADLNSFEQRLLREGYYYIGDLQGMVDQEGHYRPIDFQGINKLPKEEAARQKALNDHEEAFKRERKSLEAAQKASQP